jgi:hypothetical protein
VDCLGKSDMASPDWDSLGGSEGSSALCAIVAPDAWPLAGRSAGSGSFSSLLLYLYLSPLFYPLKPPCAGD